MNQTSSRNYVDTKKSIISEELRNIIKDNISAYLQDILMDDEEKKEYFRSCAITDLQNRINQIALWKEEAFRTFFWEYVDSIRTDELDYQMKVENIKPDNEKLFDPKKNKFQQFFSHINERVIDDIIREYQKQKDKEKEI